ncbi:sensor histidine kinase [Maridesulfovibrio sp. FT414]|uniref:sensor histidine kinase n=1 Tax=Maridesulfovibrio sp. FT414 TaxID=2979469 RepID=UPI003D80230E
MSSNSQSIKMQAVFFALIACSLLIISYSVLVNFYFEKGLLLSVRHRLELEAASYAKAYAQNPETRLPEAANFRTYLNYDHLPESIRSKAGKDELPQIGFCLIRPYNTDERLHFVYAWTRQDGNELYFVYTIGQEDRSELIYTAEHVMLYYAVGTGVIAFLIIIIIAMFMIRRITRKVLLLTDWAFALNHDNVELPAPDCQYKELNQLADLFKENMHRQLAGIRREQKFLRNASHELRTPVAVLQTNLDWLKRLGVETNKKYLKPITGMSTAVRNMKELTSTILWTSRKDLSTDLRTETRVDEQLKSIIDDNSYLLANKSVQVNRNLQELTLHTVQAPAGIIWSNIIRNAFQHTYEGEISITLSGKILTVKNDLPEDSTGSSPDSFGLGLMLIQDLTEKIGWKLTIEEATDFYSVNLLMV